MAKSAIYTLEKKKEILAVLRSVFGENASRSDLVKYIEKEKIPFPRFIFTEDRYKIARGVYSLVYKDLGAVKEKKQVVVQDSTPATAPAMAAQVHYLQQKKLQQNVTSSTIPERDKTYVPFGFFANLSSIIKSKIFYPVFVTGLSGNGKTLMVEQVCARLKRECIRINISIETEEDDLIGSDTLIDGNIVYREGPLLQAMRRGAVVILDEIDRGSNKLICLQAILEGKEYYNKKTGEVIFPAEGFNVVATANTKGRGSEDGKYTGAQLLDEAFLERFSLTIEQEYPSSAVEKKIIMNNMEIYNCLDEDFADRLTAWASIIRKTYLEEGIDEIISTRRLVHIVKAFSIFKDKLLAIELCINRFDEDTKAAFLDLYTKVDTNTADSSKEEPLVGSVTEDIKF